MDRAVFVYTTFPWLVEAEADTRVIVEQKLDVIALESVDRGHFGWILDTTKPGQSCELARRLQRRL